MRSLLQNQSMGLKYLLAVAFFVFIYLLYNANNISSSCVTKAKSTMSWVSTLSAQQWNVHSQWGEDGVIDTIFKNIGTTDKVYVEFGVEDCITQCNTRYLRELGWDVKNSLLMDGGYSNPDINLQQVIFWPSNILELFQRFGVKKEFDFLSVDTDSYDWFMIETILEAGYRPRVIVTEINANFGMLEAKSILPPKDKKSWKRWDGTTYHGSSMLAMSYLFNRFEYSVLFCNYINCFAVRDDVLGVYIRRPINEIHVQNGGGGHYCDYSNRSFAIIDPSGFWLGEDDGGLGSPSLRHTGCQHGVHAKKPYIEDIPQAADSLSQ
eukprot:TRINITY_DN13022_c0_g1_i1.p1 TRINITY_DN13022_c0_g1~~TRINITY_DN13022_c0_g1_i1.p1  ORF type:complete len:322 (+),score=55.29 TRINITY_DN13022_c0_g1_i1:56-1021(+)